MKGLLFGLAMMGILGGCLDLSESSSSSSCDQACVDDRTAVAIVNSLVFLYNTYIAFQPSGVQNFIGEVCPIGGSIDITGTTSVIGDVTDLDLDFDMTACGVSDPDFLMTYTGAINENGSFSTVSGNITRQFTSSLLTFSGTAFGSSVGESCAVGIVWNGNDLSGTICGRAF